MDTFSIRRPSPPVTVSGWRNESEGGVNTDLVTAVTLNNFGNVHVYNQGTNLHSSHHQYPNMYRVFLEDGRGNHPDIDISEVRKCIVSCLKSDPVK